ncbi:ankyrin repeat domain-containing protein 6 [Melanotaenia boesemani]|uniref:ankyrin repeat domain-containing protein 6 n=1 Tax=Melanotaenia boesemani TaxID=1250792 RepID=UPI001C05D746|nr:ankyrin repeat domain-containing protein 6 [Melanotaenia boesemani]
MENYLCKGSGHQTVLHRCAMVGNRETMAALIDGGCAVDLQDRDGNTALHEVSWHGFSRCVKLLVKAGADVHIRNKAGNTPLHLACQNAHAQTARLLVHGGSDPEAKNNVGDTCLHMAARYNNPNLLKILLGSGCCMAEKNQGGDTALHVSAALNHKKTVQLLLEAGADGRIRNAAGKTALDKARDNHHKEVALLLANAPQVRYLRGRTTRRPKLRAGPSPTVTRTEPQPDREVTSSVEDAACSRQPELRAASRVPNESDLPEGSSHFHTLKEGGDGSTPSGKTYQLYTLYRDKDGKIRQIPAGSCCCEPLLKTLEGQMVSTQEDMRQDVLNVQQKLSRRLDKMDRRTRHQLKVLDMLTQERAAAEKKKMIYRMEQRAAEGRAEVLMTQTALRHELMSWCLSQLEDMDVPVPAEAHYHKLLLSPSVEQSDLESVPLLSGDSSASLATHINTQESRSEPEQTGSRTYFEMKVDRCSDESLNRTSLPPPAERATDLLLVSAAPTWQSSGLQDSLASAASDGGASSSSRSSISHQKPAVTIQQEPSRPTDSTTVLEFYMDRPADPTFSQQRNNLHAIEVTQRFFDTVSAQLEHWCHRKILEVEQQTALRTQLDRKELVQRISMLEEELHRLKTNQNEEN